MIDSYSSLLVDASTAVRNELNEIIDELADEREEVLSGEACEPVEYVRICDAYGTGFYYIPGTETCLQIGGRIDYGSYFSPSVETGTLVLGVGDEVALDKSDTRLEGYGVGIELGIGFGGWLHKLDFDYGQAEGDSSATEPAGGSVTGITFFGMYPGSTGVGLGTLGADVKSSVEIETFGLEYEGLRSHSVHEQMRLLFGYSASAEWFRSDHESEITTPSFIDIYSETDQSVTEDAFGIGPVIGASVDFGGGFSLYGSLGIRGIYSSAELDSIQRTTCLPCNPALPLVEIETDEEEDDFTWGSKITVGFDYHPTPRLSLNLEGTVSTGPRWEADNPENPDDDPTHLNRQHGTDLKIGAGLRWAFGAPPPPPPPP